MTRDQIRAAWLIHHRQEVSVIELARRLWQQFGYASPRSCYMALLKGMKREGLYPRSQPDATSLAATKHGVFAKESTEDARRVYYRERRRAAGGARRCHGVKTRGGEMCGSAAVSGTFYCARHTSDVTA